MTKYKFYIIILFSVLSFLYGCQKSFSSDSTETDDLIALTSWADTTVCYGDTVIHAPMQYWDFDMVDSLQEFFDNLMSKHPLVVWDERKSLMGDVGECICQLEAYRSGECSTYPDSLISSCLLALESNWEVCYREFGMKEDYCFIDWFMMCVAYYSPVLPWVIEEQTPDNCAGYINIGNPYVATPCCCYLFLQRDKGFEVKCLGKNSMALEMFQLSDEQDRTYYICSYNIPSMFGQWVYWKTEQGEYLKVAEYTNTPEECEGNDIFLFSPEKLWWQSAYVNDDGDLIAICEEPALRLFIDGANSHFE